MTDSNTRAAAILASLTPAELAHAESVLQSMRPVPRGWTAEHVALTIRLGQALDGAE